ncbi:MAG: hypothetical protein K6F95_11960 [Selenomonas sp.]|uniref:hypothetical protein n=1 Tax=Selenomonas sp. TaxID=2053611 RepID=UPI0025D201E8|nr:hypothetical protein [Selenomonas sp.]MCR5758603.1 hypothetical protein [Selenomonas sp.]
MPVSPRNKWILVILASTVVGLLAGIWLCGGHSSSCNADDISVAEAKPLLQGYPAQMIELADYSPFPSEKIMRGKTVAGAEEKGRTINIPEGRQMAMKRVYPTIPQIPARQQTSSKVSEQSGSPQYNELEKNHYSSKIAFIGGEGLKIKERQGE